ncbi:xanthine dehydrogenase [Aureococcus anophagefferens]|nr:xanthine dehydrogenase [Aureococcus anophagefferens]
MPLSLAYEVEIPGVDVAAYDAAWASDPTITVNGEKRRVDASKVTGSTTLLDFLRLECGLTGAKLGCGEGGCGACTVVVSTWDVSARKPIRNGASLGGNLATASPISDMNPLLAACRATVTVAAAGGARRDLDASSFFLGYRKTKLLEDEVIESIRVPYGRPLEFVRPYKQSRRREDDIAIVTSTLRVVLAERDGGYVVQEAAFAFGGLAATARVMPGAVGVFSAADLPKCAGANDLGAIVHDEECFATEFAPYPGQVVAIAVAKTYVQAKAAAAAVKVDVAAPEKPPPVSIEQAIAAGSYYEMTRHFVASAGWDGDAFLDEPGGRRRAVVGEGMVVTEHVVEHLAHALGHGDHGGALRRRTRVRRGGVTHAQPIASCAWRVPRCVARVKETSGYDDRVAPSRPSTTRSAGLASLVPTKFGINFTAKLLNQGGSLVHLYTDGTLLVSHGGTEMGQGLHTESARSRAFVQGAGWLTTEELIVSEAGHGEDANHAWFGAPPGTLLTNGPGNYKLPSFNDAPRDFRVELLDRADNVHCVHSSKAVGEPPFFLGASVLFALQHAVQARRADRGVPGYLGLGPARRKPPRRDAADAAVARLGRDPATWHASASC